MPNNNGSLLLGLDGVVVDSVQIDDDRTERSMFLRAPTGWVCVRSVGDGRRGRRGG